jgi:hypothetical protein
MVLARRVLERCGREKDARFHENPEVPSVVVAYKQHEKVPPTARNRNQRE